MIGWRPYGKARRVRVVLRILTTSLVWLAVAHDCAASDRSDFEVIVGTQLLERPYEAKVAFGGLLKGETGVEGCHVPSSKRYVEDGFLSAQEVATLLRMASKGLQHRERLGGPSILDVNMGYVRDGAGVASIYSGTDAVSFSREEYAIYGTLFDRVKSRIQKVMGLETLYFTAPTFFARIDGNASWTPSEPHDRYFEPHVDKENTDHYDWSAVLYLSDFGTDFDGGEFVFLDGEVENGFVRGKGNKAVLPRAGRLISFAAGRENPHRFLQVTSGTRISLSMWFTCRSDRRFSSFLNGENHREFDTDTQHTTDDEKEEL